MDKRHSNPELRRFLIEQDLPHLHRERWNRITAELREQMERTSGEERARLREELDRHYLNRFRSETSRDALLAEAGLSEEK